MDKNYNKDTGKTTWLMTEWYQKTFYVIGYITIVFYSACFVLGVIAGIMEL